MLGVGRKYLLSAGFNGMWLRNCVQRCKNRPLQDFLSTLQVGSDLQKRRLNYILYVVL